jgi:mannose-6-phosphate isomerase
MERHKMSIAKEAEHAVVEIPKPWGRELLLCRNSMYAFKMIEIQKGGALSLQYHRRKHETMYFLEGRAEFIEGDLAFVAEKGRVIEIPPNTIHRVTAKEFTRIFEVSTPELDDVVRIKDEYGRESRDMRPKKKK